MISVLIDHIGLRIMNIGLQITKFGLSLVRDRKFKRGVVNAILEGIQPNGNKSLG